MPGDKHLHGLIPESNDLIQILHHAFTYQSNSCFYLISSHLKLFYSVHVAFGDELLESYTNINKWLHEQVMEPFYAPDESGKVPDLWDSVEEVFDDALLKHVKMSKHAFQCYLGLWRELNVTKEMEYPLPPIARIVPLVVAIWNTLKGGGDTITKLDDICQERLGIRTESNVATARDLLNLGVVFHRCNQMISSKDPEEYPTLYHWRDAASHRSTMKRSLATLYTTLLEMAKGAEQEESIEMANCYLSSPEEPEIRRSNRKQPNTPSIRMPGERVHSREGLQP